MTTVLIDSVGIPLVDRLVPLAASDPGVVSVRCGTPTPSEVADGPIDVVLLAASDGPDHDGTRLGGVDLDGATATLGALESVDVGALVVVSTAMVYGAWANNPIPLTEDAPLRPNPANRYAVGRAELERLVDGFARNHPDTAVSVLRPTLTVVGDAASIDWMERSLFHVSTFRQGEGDPPAQFLLVEDLARAVEHARRHRLRGAHNVAAPEWLTAQRQVELVGRGGWRRVPTRLAARFARARWSAGLSSTPPEVLPYAMNPWVVSSDRLRSTGWEPTASNEEAFVVGSRPGWWSTLTGRRRQEITLGALVTTVVGLVVAVAVAGRVRRRGQPPGG